MTSLKMPLSDERIVARYKAIVIWNCWKVNS